MPLSEEKRRRFDYLPELNFSRIPPRVKVASGPQTTEINYQRLEFDRNEDKIGKGGTAIVYRATDNNTKRPIAIKEPIISRTDNTINNKQTITRLLKEAEKWARVDDHPYIGSVIDWGYDGVPWIALEYMDGGSLVKYIGEEKLTKRLWIAYAVADAVAYASGQHGVIHHDLKPQNILFRKTPENTWNVPKVCDWGIAKKLIQHDGSNSQVTPKYAAPEQQPATMPNVDTGPHTDVYQLGVICYELLTGKHPNHLRGSVIPPSDINGSLPPGIDEFLLTALNHDRQVRYDHPVSFRNQLKKIVYRQLSASGESSTRENYQGTITNRSELKTFRSEPEPVLHWQFNADASITASPTARNETIYMGCSDGRLYAVDAIDGEQRWVFNSGGEIYSSPTVVDGTVYFMRTDQYGGELCAVDAASGEKRYCECGPEEYGRGRVGFSPVIVDNTVYTVTRRGILARDAATGKTKRYSIQTKPNLNVDTRSDLRSSPAIADGTIYFGIRNSMYALDTITYEQKWTFDCGNKINSSPVVDMDAVYFGSDNGNLYALDANEGKIKWRFKTRDKIRASPAVTDGIVYTGSWDGTLYAVDAATGDEKWNFSTGARIDVSPVIVEGSVYFGSNDQRLYAVDASTGEKEWVFKTDRTVQSSPAVWNKTIYIGDQDGSLYALR